MNYKKTLVHFSLCLTLLHSFLHAKSEHNQTYHADYVIIGAGTAGAVLAKKLSDDKETSVIAIHNGENLNGKSLIKYSRNVPITVLSSLFHSKPLYMGGNTVPQSFANDNELLWVLSLPEGGASAVNAGAYVRGTNQVYAQWEAIAGPLWSVERILKTYKELEHYHGETTNPAVRGYHGPLRIRQVQDPTAVSQKFTQAIINGLGVPFVLDYNDPATPIGASSQLQYTQRGKNGKFRVSSGNTFLNKKVMTPDGHGLYGRKLTVLFNTFAMKTIWEGNKAIGVEVLRHGKRKKVFAKKGIIVCAGLYSSAFLMHSGIGPKSVIEGLHIPLKFDNPNVGQGLVDQPHVPTIFSINPNDANILKTNSFFAQIAMLPSPSETEGRAVRFSAGNPLTLTGDTLYGINNAVLNLAPVKGTGVLKSFLDLTNQNKNQNRVANYVFALVDLLQPLSRGEITIHSSDPFKHPLINPGVLSNLDDLDLYVQAFRFYVGGINDALQAIDPQYKLVIPPPSILNDDILLIEYIKSTIQSNQSYQSHCRMAPLEQGGVVDSTGRVYGVHNLFVADDSIVPQCMDGAPMASAYLIGANIANIILQKQER